MRAFSVVGVAGVGFFLGLARAVMLKGDEKAASEQDGVRCG